VDGGTDAWTYQRRDSHGNHRSGDERSNALRDLCPAALSASIRQKEDYNLAILSVHGSSPSLCYNMQITINVP